MPSRNCSLMFPEENFDPAPEVDSAVIQITRKKNPPKADASEFFSLVRAGFSAKRKMLVNNLSSSFHIPKTEAADTIKKSQHRADRKGTGTGSGGLDEALFSLV